MRRRDFLSLLAAAALPLPLRAEPRVPRIGFLGLFPPQAEQPAIEALTSGLVALGWAPGATVELVFRTADGQGEERLTELAKELVDLKVDVIVTGGPGVFVAYRVTKTTPIVSASFGSVDELIAMGMVASLDRPGGNLTGETFLLDKLHLKRIELLRAIKPAMTNVGLLTLAGSTFNQFVRNLEGGVRALGVTPVLIELSAPDDCERALAGGQGASIEGLMVADMPQFSMGPGPAAIAAACLRRALPAAGPPTFARSGGLLSYDVDFIPMFNRAAVFVDKILRGAKPRDIPIEQATKFETVVNLKTAKALGLDIPSTLLAAADEVIE